MSTPLPTTGTDVPIVTAPVIAGPDIARPKGHREEWSYEEAFARNEGLINPTEQRRLRKSRIAIIGMGGVGGIHLATLARLGIGAFNIADPDKFEVANFNRQYGAETKTIGHKKAQVMGEKALAINPDADIKIFNHTITPDNVREFLAGVDLVIDGIDFFSIESRRLVFRTAQQLGIWAVTAGPIGFSTAWLVFDPGGMRFDTYFDLKDSMDRAEQLIAFAVGLTPRATHLSYLDLSQVDPRSEQAPSASLACHLASGVAAAEAIKILLQRRPIRPVPWYFQFDAYRHLLHKGRLRLGNRHPWQLFKRWWLRRRFAAAIAAMDH